jgi:hypothetical protein
MRSSASMPCTPISSLSSIHPIRHHGFERRRPPRFASALQLLARTDPKGRRGKAESRRRRATGWQRYRRSTRRQPGSRLSIYQGARCYSTVGGDRLRMGDPTSQYRRASHQARRSSRSWAKCRLARWRGGEGKSTALRQLAWEASQDGGWVVLWSDRYLRDQTTSVPISFVGSLSEGTRVLICIDDTETITGGERLRRAGRREGFE